MGNLSDYFEKKAYKPKWFIGDRVFGYWNKIPFVGTVGNDTVIDDTGPRISIHLDLPIKHLSKVHNLLVVNHKEIKNLKKLVEIK